MKYNLKSLFQSHLEYSLEIDFPLEQVWDFCLTPSNWTKWIKNFESCDFSGELKPGSIIKYKIKMDHPKDLYISVIVNEIDPYSKCVFLIKDPLLNQESTCIFKEIAPNKTHMLVTAKCKGFLAPFTRIFSREIKKAKSKEIKLLLASMQAELANP